MDSGEDENFCNDVEKMKPTAVFLGYIAQLVCSKFGVSYGDGTGTYYFDCQSVLENQMNVKIQDEEFNWKGLITTLTKGYPVYTHSYHIVGYYSEYGHAFIIDEANEIQEVWYDVYANGPKKGGSEIVDDDESENNFPTLDYYREMYENISFNVSLVLNEQWMKMNWGWNGRYDDVSINADEKVWEVSSYSFNDNNIFTIK